LTISADDLKAFREQHKSIVKEPRMVASDFKLAALFKEKNNRIRAATA